VIDTVCVSVDRLEGVCELLADEVMLSDTVDVVDTLAELLLLSDELVDLLKELVVDDDPDTLVDPE
jgi:hypothetical protein